jgi:hypothetical protein
VLAASGLAERLTAPAVARRWARGGLAAACALGVLLTVVAHRSDWFYPLLTRLVGPPSESSPFPLRKIDPTCRLRGWRTLAARLDELRAALRAEGVEPVLAGTNWSVPGLLGFYCQGWPQAYSVGMALSDRASQYDLWPGPVSHPDAFRGRTFLVVGPPDDDLRQAFESLEGPYDVRHYERGEPIAAWSIFIGRGYKGFPPSRAQRQF